MAKKFSCDLTRVGYDVTLTLSGVLDEDASIPMPMLSGTENIRIDFAGITGINSVGVRFLCHFIMAAQDRCRKIVYFNCRAAIIDQLLSLSNLMTPKTHVESLFVPVFCQDCNKESEVFATAADLSDGTRLTMPACPERNCGMQPEIDKDALSRILKIPESA